MAAPMVPMLLTACQPPAKDCSGRSRELQAHFEADDEGRRYFGGVAPVLSATAIAPE